MKPWLIILVAACAIVAAGCAIYFVFNNGGSGGDEPAPEPFEGTLPDLFISTDGGAGIDSKDDYIGCTVSVDDSEYPLSEQAAKIKGRGNTTWMYDKKPYNIKFESKTDMFGIGAAKKWCLLADYGDVSLVRNYLVLNTADAIGCAFTPECRHVNLYLNGAYQGVYLLTEKVEIGKNRVNIDDTATDDDIGFLIEMDIHAYGDPNADPGFSIGLIRYTLKDPECDSKQMAMIQNRVIQAFNALDSGDWSKVSSFIDTDSFVSTYIIEELFKDADVTWSSFFLYHDLGGKICSGPIWDFDKSTANQNFTDLSANTSDYVTLQAAKNVWYKGLLSYPEFRQALAEELVRCHDIILSELDSCREYASSHREDFEHNFTLWKYEDIQGFLLSFCGLTHAQEIERICDWVPLSLEHLMEVYVQD